MSRGAEAATNRGPNFFGLNPIQRGDRRCGIIYLGLLAIGTLILTANSFAADESPYEAVVLDHGAEVRAGPGQRFYVTQELEPGTRVEVYRREAGDWLAIRPPEGSFSWIPQADLEMTEEPGIAEISSEEAKSWLGSRAERIKEHKSHVTLARGERVEVLGKKQVEDADGKTQLWMKIAPPAGEFRWVQSRQVRRAKKSELAAKDAAQPVARKCKKTPSHRRSPRSRSSCNPEFRAAMFSCRICRRRSQNPRREHGKKSRLRKETETRFFPCERLLTRIRLWKPGEGAVAGRLCGPQAASIVTANGSANSGRLAQATDEGQRSQRTNCIGNFIRASNDECSFR